MRRLLVALLALLALSAPAAAQFSFLGLKNSLVDFVLNQISVPGELEVTAEGVEDAEDGSTRIVGLSVADAAGVWLHIERLSVNWSSSRILLGQLKINRLAAEGVDVRRRPNPSAVAVEVKEDEEEEKAPGSIFDWPRSPINTRIDDLELLRVTIAPGVISAQGLAFDAKGAAQDEGPIQAAKLDLHRTDDVAGHIALDYKRDFKTDRLDVTLDANEAAGGLVAALAGFPVDSASRVNLVATGPLTDWRITLGADVDNVISAEGEGTVSAQGRIAANAELTVTPGEALAETYGPAVAAALAPNALIRFDMTEGENGVIAIREGVIRSAELDGDASGTFDRTNRVADLALKLEARTGLSALAEGVEFQRVGFDGAVSGPMDGLSVNGRLALEGLKTEPADVASADLDARMLLEGEKITLDLDGGASGLRLDKLGPELIGEAEITVDGVYDGGSATLSGLRVSATPLTLEASGAADLEGGSVDLNYRLSAPELAPLAAAYGQDAAGALSADGAVSGALDAPTVKGSLALDGLAYQGKDYGALTLDHDVTVGPAPEGVIALRSEGSPFGPAAFDGGFRLDGQQLSLKDLVATGLGARIAGALEIDLETTLASGALDLDAPDLSTLSGVTGLPASGAASGRVKLAAEEGRQDASVDLVVDKFLAELPAETETPDSVGAPSPAAAGGEVRAKRLLVDLDVTDALGAPSAKGKIEADDVAALGYGAAALRLAGEAAGVTSDRMSFDVTGGFEAAALGPATIASGDLSASGDLAAMDVDVTLREVVGDESIGGAALGEANLKAHVIDAAGDPAVQAELIAKELAGYGIALASLNVSGDVSAIKSAPEFDVAAKLGAVDLGGAKLAGADVAAKGTLEDMTATVRAGRLAADGAAIAATSFDARVREATGGDPGINASVTLGRADLGGASLSSTTLKAQGKLSALEIAMDARGALDNGDPLIFSTAIGAALADAPQAVIKRLRLAAGEAEIGLRSPLKIAVDGADTRFGNIDVALPGGGLTGAATLHPDGLSGDLALDIPDLAPLAELANAPIERGAFTTAAQFDTRGGSAGAKISARASHIDFKQTLSESGGLTIDADVNWDGRTAELDSSLVGPFGQPVRIAVTTPLRPSGGPVPTIPANGALSGSVDWSGEIGTLWALAPAPGHFLAGATTVALKLGGTLDKPEVGGDISLKGGRYENLDAGTILVNLDVEFHVELGGAFVVTVDAEDGSDHPVTAKISLEDGEVDATIGANSAILVRRDDVTAAVSIDLAAKGPLSGPDIRGTVNIDRAEVRLVAATPPGVADIGKVRFKGDEPPPPEEPFGEDIDLHIDVTGDHDIYVRGRGLDSEWQVDLKIRGTAADPRITGAVEKRRGVLNFLGRTFDLDPGEIRFPGGKGIDPILNISMLHENDGVRGGIVVSGAASDPDISFQSKPALPEDEVLPRVLFGEFKQSLTPTEALSLAAGVATLLDGTGGGVDSVRSAVGLDVLRVDDTGAGATVTAGSNITDNVFVGAKQPISGGSASVVVEIEVLDDFQIDSEVGPDVGTSLGVKWKKDF